MTDTRPLSIEQRLVRAWYAKRSWIQLLAPLAWLFRLLVAVRRSILQARYQGRQFAVPVAVVGNISVGGSGKTPLLIALVRALAERGYRVAVISRGYGVQAASRPLEVKLHTAVEHCGDEPLLIKRSVEPFGCSVVIGANRKQAADYVVANCPCDLILSDDGMQHYRLHRDIEIAVVDGARGFGNGLCIPAGPLREPVSRLLSVNFIASNGPFKGSPKASLKPAIDCEFTMQPVAFRHLASGEQIQADAWSLATQVHAVAGIGNPQRFAASLESLGLQVNLHAADDHQRLESDWLDFNDGRPVIITEKDAVKLKSVSSPHIWVLEAEISLPNEFIDRFLHSLNLSQHKAS